MRRKGYVQGRISKCYLRDSVFCYANLILASKSHTSFVRKEVGGEEATFMYVQMTFACCFLFVGAFAFSCKLDFYKRLRNSASAYLE